MPLADENTDLKRNVLESTLTGANEASPFALVCSRELNASIRLVLEALDPLRELVSVQHPIGLDGANHMPALTTVVFQKFVGGIPAVEQYINDQFGRKGSTALELGVRFSYRFPGCRSENTSVSGQFLAPTQGVFQAKCPHTRQFPPTKFKCSPTFEKS